MKLTRSILLTVVAAFGDAPAARAQGPAPSPSEPLSVTGKSLSTTDAARAASETRGADEAVGTASRIAGAQRDVVLGKLAKAPTLDGVLGEGEWQGAARAELLFQVQPGDNAAPSERTELFLAADREHLYVAFRCLDSNPAAIRAPVSRRDAVYGDDYVALYLDTYDDRRRSYVFYFNPLGIQADAVITGGTLQTTGGEVADLTWDGILASKGLVAKDSYVVEAAIPFKSLRFRAGKGRRWGMHIQRWIARKAERVYWQPISRDRSELLAQMGTLSGLDDVDAGRTLDLIPTLTGTISGERERDPHSPGSARLNHVNRLEPGLTLTYTLTPNLTLSAAVNPDFSQIEADTPQVDVNQRFPLFFPERRPFFLEGDELFRSAGLLTFVNTRQIVDPVWGLKLTGKVGKNSVGFLSASDRAPGLRVAPTHPDFGEKAAFNVLRYGRDVLRDSRIGFFLADRRFAGTRNTVFAADGQLRFREVNTVGFQLARSSTRSADGGTRPGSATYGWYEHRGRHWRLFFNDLRVTREYRAQTGFVRRTGFHQNGANLGYEFQPKERSWWVSVRPFVVPRLLRTDEGLLDESFVDPGFDLRLARGISFYVYRSFRRDSFRGREYPYRLNIANYTVNSFRRIAFDGNVQWGEGVNFDPANPKVGRAWNSQTTLTIRPTESLFVSLLHVRSNLRDKETGARLFNQDIFRTRATYQLTRFNALRAILDYDTARRQMGASVLFAYTPRPNTALFLGFNDLLFNGLDPLAGARAPGLFRQRRTLFTKLSYNFRF
jgi:hypothetical protein